MLKVLIAPVTPFQQNCSIVWCDETMEGTAVDPGGDFDMLKQAIAEQGIKVTKVLLTHGHVDHASAAGTMADHYGVKIEGPHKDDLFLIEGLPASGRKYNFPVYKPFVPDRWLEGGETVSLGNLTFDVVHCPGHTPGHVVFVHKPAKVAFVGDVLFRGSIGRTDFPRGNHEQLLNSIRKRLWPLGDDITFVPGHGETSTFGWSARPTPSSPICCSTTTKRRRVPSARRSARTGSRADRPRAPAACHRQPGAAHSAAARSPDHGAASPW